MIQLLNRRGRVATAILVVLGLIVGVVWWQSRDGSSTAILALEPTTIPDPAAPTNEPTSTRDAGGPAEAATGDAFASSAERTATGMVATLSPIAAGAPIAQVGHRFSTVVQVSGVAPIVAVELWAGSDLVDSIAESSRVDPTWTVPLRWTPTSIGTTLLIARAIDADGHSTTSNSLALGVVEPSAFAAIVSYETKSGDTLASIADRFGVPIEAVLSSGRGAADIFAEGETVGVPLLESPDGTALIPPPIARPAADEPQPNSLPLDPLPTAAVGADGCRSTISLAWSGEPPASVTLVRADRTSGLFTAVDASVTQSGDKLVFTDVPMGPGTQLYAIEVISDAGTVSTTPPVEVHGADDCGGNWEGPLRIEQGVLLGVPADVDRVYLYFGQGAAWKRVPADGQATLARFDDVFGLASEMPDVSGSDELEIEVWGWRNGALENLGRSRFSPRDGVDPTWVVGRARKSSLALISSPAGTEPETLSTDQWIAKPAIHRFRWSTEIPGTTHGLWQVLSFAPTPNQSPMTFGVLASGEVTGSSGTFDIDLGAIIGSPPEARLVTSALPTYAAIAGPAVLGELRSAAPLPPGGVEFADEANALQATVATDLLLPRPTNLFIRVVPMITEQWSGVTTNTAKVRLGDPTLADLIDSVDFDALNEPIDPSARPYELSATILPPTPPNPAYQACWQFDGWNWLERVQHPELKAQYDWWDTFSASVGADMPLCAGVCYHSSLGKVIWSGKNCGGGGSWIPILSELATLGATLWDVLVTGFNAIKGFVVDSIVTLSGCQAVASKAFCNTLATLAVNAVLVAYGIPPNLPNAEQLKQAAKGQLREAVLAAAQDLGVPCAEVGAATSAAGADDISCEALIDKAIAVVDQQISEYFVDAALQTSGIGFPPGAIVRPAPLGQTGAPIVTMTLTPTAGAPQLVGKTCNAMISMLASWAPPDTNVPFGAYLAATANAPNRSIARLPNWAAGGGAVGAVDLWSVPKQTYDGFVVTAMVELPTEQLTFGPGGPSGTATRTYFPPLNYTDPVEAVQMIQTSQGLNAPPSWTSFVWACRPEPALQLHRGAYFVAEIYSPCFGVYRYVNPSMAFFGQTSQGAFVKIS